MKKGQCIDTEIKNLQRPVFLNVFLKHKVALISGKGWYEIKWIYILVQQTEIFGKITHHLSVSLTTYVQDLRDFRSNSSDHFCQVHFNSLTLEI